RTSTALQTPRPGSPPPPAVRCDTPQDRNPEQETTGEKDGGNLPLAIVAAIVALPFFFLGGGD
ncbi:hypothetical protein, partial [Prochlorothrix hollandica]|uniref:hypothetical protein n=1 Tax=Prochlorothrix hollandica TaxID=1223 RepID=UPI00334033B9